MNAPDIWLIDVSASMAGERYERMKAQLTELHAAAPGTKLIAFNTLPRAIERPDRLPWPGGSTAMHLAIGLAAQEAPARVVIFSDGEPDDRAMALDAASGLPGLVDTLFFGDEGDVAAKQFMEQIARDNGGRWLTKDILKDDTLLSGDVRDLLGLASPGAAGGGRR